MNYHNITHDDMLNGEGLRVTLWVSGCTHRCVGCQNPETWDINSGIEFDEDAKKEIFNELDKPHISGITFSGGDPLHPYNIREIKNLCKEIRAKYGNTKTIWLYTGYRFETIDINEILLYIDVLVDGRFIAGEGDPATLKWRGSSNQRVIDVQETLRNFNNKEDRFDIILYSE